MTQTVTQPVAVQADYQRIPGNTAVATVSGGKPVGNGSADPAGQAVWGFITGTIDNQADLIVRLNAKLDTTTYNAAVPPHIDNQLNPHNVTKAQVGLGNADDTSDMNKPVSTAQQNAINAAVADRVAKAGDSMTGGLTIEPVAGDPTLILRKTATLGSFSTVFGYTGVNARWRIAPGNGDEEGGANTGSNFSISAYADAGTLLTTPFVINRSTGQVQIVQFNASQPGLRLSSNTAMSVRMDLMKTTAGFENAIRAGTGSMGTGLRWVMTLGDTTAESGTQAGSNFQITRYSDVGGSAASALFISRKNGYVALGAGTLRANTLTDAAGQTVLELNKTASGVGNHILGNSNGALRWAIRPGNADAEAGTNTGSGFDLSRFSDDGSSTQPVLQISRANGFPNFGPGAPRVTAADTGSVFLELTKTASGSTTAVTGCTNGILRWVMRLGDSTAEGGGDTGSDFIIHRYSNLGALIAEAMRIRRSSGEVTLGGSVVTSGNIQCGTVSGGYVGKAGWSGGYSGSVHNWFWTGALQAWVDGTNVGNVTLTSDERVKHTIVPLADAHEVYMGIQPVEYSWADVGIFKDDGRRHWGFSAQQLLDCGFDKAVEGSVTEVQADGTPQPAHVQDRPILAQTVLEVQALWTRVEELESKLEAALARITQLEGA